MYMLYPSLMTNPVTLHHVITSTFQMNSILPMHYSPMKCCFSKQYIKHENYIKFPISDHFVFVSDFQNSDHVRCLTPKTPDDHEWWCPYGIQIEIVPLPENNSNNGGSRKSSTSSRKSSHSKKKSVLCFQ